MSSSTSFKLGWKLGLAVALFGAGCGGPGSLVSVGVDDVPDSAWSESAALGAFDGVSLRGQIGAYDIDDAAVASVVYADVDYTSLELHTKNGLGMLIVSIVGELAGPGFAPGTHVVVDPWTTSAVTVTACADSNPGVYGYEEPADSIEITVESEEPAPTTDADAEPSADERADTPAPRVFFVKAHLASGGTAEGSFVFRPH
jgi:hypothetical protein